MTHGYNSTHHRTIFILINFLMSNLQCVLFYINNIMYKASHLIIFVSFFTHFKWSKPGLKQNCEASLSPINQDFLESCQCTTMAYEKYLNHCFFSSQIAVKCRILQGFISISRYRSFLLIYYIFCKKVQNEANHFHL